ncbi:MAG TPA: GNAT family N-acetyltransferase [Streptosporangiaceae bacterium]|nr:GNAT family N-acetyltransferase [Streptosporangiaceae bacterium]
MTISVSGLEEVAALGWRGTEEDRLGGWLLRAAGGFTGRANSALAVGDPGLPLRGAAAAVRRWYAARDLSPMISVPYPCGRPAGSAVDRFLAGQGWTVRPGAATVMTAAAAAIAGAGPAAPAPVHIDTEPDRAWLARYHYRGQPELPPAARQVLRSAPWQAFGSVRENGAALAIGRVAVARGWAGLTAIEVDPAHRRRGLARALTAALASQAATRGARWLYLQVEDGNQPALGLYHRIGFTDHHGYHYRVAPPGQPHD